MVRGVVVNKDIPGSVEEDELVDVQLVPSHGSAGDDSWRRDASQKRSPALVQQMQSVAAAVAVQSAAAGAVTVQCGDRDARRRTGS